MVKNKFSVDERFKEQALESIPKDYEFHGVTSIGAGDIRIWFKDKNGKLGCQVETIKKKENIS